MTQQGWRGGLGGAGGPQSQIGVPSGLADSFSDHVDLWPPLSSVAYRTFRRRPTRETPAVGKAGGRATGAPAPVRCRRPGKQRCQAA